MLAVVRVCRRQRQQVVLGNRVPTAAPDTWLAPDAILIGDVDLFDRVCAHCSV